MPFDAYSNEVYLNTLDIFFCWILSCVWFGQSIEGSATILRVLCLFWCFRCFWRRLQSGRWIVSFFPLELAWFPSDIIGVLRSCHWVWSYQGSPLMLLLSSLRPFNWSFGSASLGLFIPKFSLTLRVFRSSRKDCFAIVSDVLGSFFPAFCWSCLEINKV